MTPERCDLRFREDGDAFVLRVEYAGAAEEAPWRAPIDRAEWRAVQPRFRHDAALARDLGERLFLSVAHGDAGRLFTQAVRSGVAVQVRLHLGDAWIAAIAWELLRDPQRGVALAASALTPVLRVVDRSVPVETVRPAVVEQLGVLVVTASPRDREPLDEERHWSLIRSGGRIPRVSFDRVSHATRTALARALLDREWAIVHIVCHGSFDVLRGEGVLWFEDEHGLSDAITAQELATLLIDAPRATRLVALSACKGAHGGLDDASASVARSLVRVGVPLVIAMQCEIDEEAAALFAGAFYSALSTDGAAEAALAHARRVMTVDRLGAQWSASVLLTAGEDLRVYDVLAADAAVRAYVTITGDEGAYRLAIRRSHVTIGRDVAPPDVALHDERVSGVHADIEIRDDGFIVCDRSTNGTFAGEERLEKNVPRTLPFGTTLRVRPFTVRLDGPDGAPQTRTKRID